MLVILGSLGTLAFAQSSYVPPVVGTTTTTIYNNSGNEFGTNSGNAVVVDKAGNVYYTNSLVSPFNAYELPYAAPAGTPVTPIPLITGFCQYCGHFLFVDPKGDLWIGEGGSLYEFPAVNGIPNTTAVPSGGYTETSLAAVTCTVSSTAPCSLSGLAGVISPVDMWGLAPLL